LLAGLVVLLERSKAFAEDGIEVSLHSSLYSLLALL